MNKYRLMLRKGKGRSYRAKVVGGRNLNDAVSKAIRGGVPKTAILSIERLGNREYEVHHFAANYGRY